MDGIDMNGKRVRKKREMRRLRVIRSRMNQRHIEIQMMGDSEG